METEKAEISLEDLKKGSDRVLRQVYEENRDKFLNFAKRYDLPRDEYIDVYQDTYVIFYDNVMNGKIKSFTSSIATYLFGIGKYLIYERMRQNRKTISGDYDLSSVGETDERVSTIELETPELTAKQKLLQTHFETLGKKCQKLLTLFYYRGLTIHEIMEHEKYNSENVVKAAKSRCLKTLRERIRTNGKAMM